MKPGLQTGSTTATIDSQPSVEVAARSLGADAFHELLLRGGHVVGVHERPWKADVAFRAGRVAAIGERLPVAGAEVDVRGCLVAPGFVDIHTHVFTGLGLSTDPDVSILKRGTTTAVDAGTAGANTFGAFRLTSESRRTRVLAWLNLSTIGQVDERVGELLAAHHLDVDAAVETASANPDLIVGFKARLSTYAAGGSCLPALRLLRLAADRVGLPIMVHVGDSAESLETILDGLAPGDVVTHTFTEARHGIVDADLRVLPEVWAARRRGILFDAAPGRNHLSFRVLDAAVQQGFPPDIVSTDLTSALATSEPDYSLASLCSLFLSDDVGIDEVIRWVTSTPAAAIHRPDLGRLYEEGPGDATVLRLQAGELTMRDARGRSRLVTQAIRPVGVVRNGHWIAADAPSNGPTAGSLPI